MRGIWWLLGQPFLCSLVVWSVGTGWLSATAVNSAVRHGRRRVGAEVVVADMVAAQQALRQHCERAGLRVRVA